MFVRECKAYTAHTKETTGHLWHTVNQIATLCCCFVYFAFPAGNPDVHSPVLLVNFSSLVNTPLRALLLFCICDCMRQQQLCPWHTNLLLSG